MKTLFTIIVILTVYHNFFAQNFSQQIQNNATLDARNYGVLNYSLGYKIGISEVDINNDFRKTVKLITTDNDGDIQNTMVYEATDSNYSISCSQIINLANNTQIVSGTYSINNNTPYFPYLMKINANGSINWAKKINSNKGNPPVLKLLSDGTILAIFESLNPSIHKVFCKLDSNGNLSSFKDVFAAQGSIEGINTYNTTFDLLFINGNILNINNDLSSVNWQRKYYNEIGIVFNRTTNGDYIYASAQVSFPGYMTIFRTDVSGNLIWAKYIESWEGAIQSQISIFDIVGFHFIKEDTIGNIIVSANSEGGQSGSFNVVLDSNGNYINNYKIKTVQNETFLLNNDQYLLGGFENYSSYNTSDFIFENRNLIDNYQCDTALSYTIVSGSDMSLTADIYALTPITFTTENLNISFSSETISQNSYCDMVLSVNENSRTENKINIYPNPSSNKIWIESNLSVIQIKLYNHLGQHLETQSQSTVDISKYANGIYFLEIELENNFFSTKKLIKN